MRLLLDSQALLWALTEWNQLLEQVVQEIQSPENSVYFSPISIMELDVKLSQGLLELDADLATEAVGIGFTELPIRSSHVLRMSHLPTLHTDPFDRMLIAQALDEDLTIVTRDPVFPRYGVPVLQC